jgi:hypothetical protein
MNGSREELRFPDGTVIEIHRDVDHYLHRDDGPAWALRTPNGVSVEMYFLHGKLQRNDGPAVCAHHPGGAGADGYFLDGRHVGPNDLPPPPPKGRGSSNSHFKNG